MREADFPRTKRLDTFDFNANRPSTQRLSTPWPRAHGSILDSRCASPGKAHLLIGLGIAAAGGRVRYITAAALVNELVEAADDKSLSRTIARYGRVDLFCVDELDYLALAR